MSASLLFGARIAKRGKVSLKKAPSSALAKAERALAKREKKTQQEARFRADFRRSMRAAGDGRVWRLRRWTNNGVIFSWTQSSNVEIPGRYRQTVRIQRGRQRETFILDTHHGDQTQELIAAAPELILEINKRYPVR